MSKKGINLPQFILRFQKYQNSAPATSPEEQMAKDFWKETRIRQAIRDSYRFAGFNYTDSEMERVIELNRRPEGY